MTGTPGKRKPSEFTSRSVYTDLRYLFITRDPRRKPDELLALTKDQFDGARSEFVAREVPRIIPPLKQLAAKCGEPAEEMPEDGEVPSTDPSTVQRLDTLLMLMHLQLTDKAYEKASKEFDHIIRSLKPKKRKRHAIKDKVLEFSQYLAQRKFMWAILKGEWRFLSKRCPTSGSTLSELRKHYDYLSSELAGDENEITGRLSRDSVNDLAFQDAADKYGGSPDGLRTMLTPSKW
jgi:hypothetical protein